MRDDKLFFKIIHFDVCNLSRDDGLSIDAKLPLFTFVCKYFVALGVPKFSLDYEGIRNFVIAA